MPRCLPHTHTHTGGGPQAAALTSTISKPCAEGSCEPTLQVPETSCVNNCAPVSIHGLSEVYVHTAAVQSTRCAMDSSAHPYSAMPMAAVLKSAQFQFKPFSRTHAAYQQHLTPAVAVTERLLHRAAVHANSSASSQHQAQWSGGDSQLLHLPDGTCNDHAHTQTGGDGWSPRRAAKRYMIWHHMQP